MSLAIAVGLAQTGLCALLATSLLVFLRQYDRGYIRRWVAGLVALGVFFGVQSAYQPLTTLPPGDPLRLGWSLVYITAGYLGPAWILAGMFELSRNRPLSRVALVRLTVALVAVSVVLVLGTIPAPTPVRYFLRVPLRSLLVGGAFLLAAVDLTRLAFARGARGPRFVFLLFAWFGIFELHNAGVAFSWLFLDVGPPRYWEYRALWDLFGVSALSIGTLLWLAQDEWARAAEVDAALERSEATYRVLFDNAVIGIGRATLAGEPLQANEKVAEIFGYDSAAQYLAEYAALNHWDEDARQRIREVLDRQGYLDGYESIISRLDGSERWVRSWARLDSERGYFDFAIEDVTREKESEAQRAHLYEQLQQSQKMEAVGQLTGGIAHDFNNLLTVMLGNVDLAGESMDEPIAMRAHLAQARDAMLRATRLTQRLLAFSRKQALRPEPLDLNRLVSSMADLLHRSLGELIEIQITDDPDPWLCEADRNQVEGAILNLAINARDAMPDGGRLSIEVRKASLPCDDGPAPAAGDVGEYVGVSVTDTGHGMPPDVAEKAFEPFFTTKGAGEGTGLGLSMVYGFVKQSGGQVRISTEVGRGTTVSFFLPRASDEVTLTIHTDREREHPRGTGERILVVEDDDAVRALTVTMLRQLGYEVEEASSGPMALERLGSLSDVRLLFSDVVLPGGMNGAELAREVQRRQPDLKVLLTSGYATDSIARDGRLERGVELLEKPFSRQALAERVGAMLGDGRPARP